MCTNDWLSFILFIQIETCTCSSFIICHLSHMTIIYDYCT